MAFSLVSCMIIHSAWGSSNGHSLIKTAEGWFEMAISRKNTILSLLKGLLAAVGLTLAMMAAVAALAVGLRISDGLILALNQVMKLSAIVLGALVAIGRGGQRGFFTGMALAMLYMALGYGCYVLLGGSAFVAGELLGEILIGASVGGIAGAVLSNMKPTRRARGRKLPQSA